MTIGDFSRAVRLSAKALRFYHRSGLLTPAVIDERTGYRRYAAVQIDDARVVRALRRLDVPIDAIRDVLEARSVTERSDLMRLHLEQMEGRLAETRVAVEGLRALLDPPAPPIEIAHRSVPARRVVAISDEIALDDLGRWFRAAIGSLTAIRERGGSSTPGPLGGLWPNDLFTEGRGVATVFVPIEADVDERALTGPDRGARAHVQELPPVELVVAIHTGSDETLPRAYAALGEYVARHELSTDAPARETYLEGIPGIDDEAVTEVGWPIFRVSR